MSDWKKQVAMVCFLVAGIIAGFTVLGGLVFLAAMIAAYGGPVAVMVLLLTLAGVLVVVGAMLTHK